MLIYRIRTKIYENPEEANKIFADHASSLLCAPDSQSLKNLKKEGLGEKSYFTGDVMYDSFCYYKSKIDTASIMTKYGLNVKGYILMTWHRQENTSNINRMSRILDFMESIKRPVICPMHPRTYHKLDEYGILERAMKIEGFQIIEPVGYLEMIALESNSRMIITDSGGLSKESYFAGVKCMYMLDIDVWQDLQSLGWIKRMSESVQNNLDIVDEIFNSGVQKSKANRENFYGDGYAAMKIVDLIENLLLK